MAPFGPKLFAVAHQLREARSSKGILDHQGDVKVSENKKRSGPWLFVTLFHSKAAGLSNSIKIRKGCARFDKRWQFSLFARFGKFILILNRVLLLIRIVFPGICLQTWRTFLEIIELCIQQVGPNVNLYQENRTKSRIINKMKWT